MSNLTRREATLKLSSDGIKRDQRGAKLEIARTGREGAVRVQKGGLNNEEGPILLVKLDRKEPTRRGVLKGEVARKGGLVALPPLRRGSVEEGPIPPSIPPVASKMG
jgi:hypothetical protein